MNKYIYTFLLIASTTLVGAEVSVFDAGNLDSKNPYGLNSSEKHILKNQKNISNISSKVNDLNLLIESVKRRIEGLESIYEGDSSKLNDTVLKVNELMKKVDVSADLVTKNQEDTNEIKSVSQELLNMKAQTDKEIRANIATLKKAVSKISSLVNKINSQYVSSKELEKNMSQFITKEEFEEFKKSIGSNVPTKKIASSSKVNKEKDEVKLDLSSSAKRAKFMKTAKLEFKKKYFNNAIPKFEKLIELNYKPAESNYYLGEMWYVRKKYTKAINYFKRSAILYDKASYMPNLLLHSAISFEKLKDRENAKSFYQTLVELYPNSNEAKTAKKNLKKL